MLPILLIAVLSLLAQLVLPWWSIALVTFAFCLVRSESGKQAFWHSFLGVALVWLGYALLIHIRTDGLMTARMAQLFFKTASPIGLLIVTPLIAGLTAGLSGLAGYLTRTRLALG